MAALPRSEVSFRRSGSSGLVWDDKYLSGELKPIQTKEGEDAADNHKPNKDHDQSKDQRQQAYRTVEITPTIDPPSPKVSAGCGICFGKAKPEKKTHKRKPGHRKS